MIAKVVAVAAVTTIVSVALTSAVGIVAKEVLGGGAITGDVLGQATDAAVQGFKSLVDPANLTKKAVTKIITKGHRIKE